MGVQDGGRLLFHVDIPTISQLCDLLRRRNDANDRGPTVAFDANWLYRKFGNRKGKDGPFVAISDLAFIFAANGINVVVVADGPTRHHSKRATPVRRKDASQAQTEFVAHRAELMRKVEQSRSQEITAGESKILKKTIETLESKVKKKEKQASANMMPPDFVQLLEEEVVDLQNYLTLLDCRNRHVPSVSFVQAKTQADCVICHMAVRNQIQAAVANDCDFVVVAGKSMLLITDFTMPRNAKAMSSTGEPKNAKLSKIKIAYGFESVVDKELRTVLQLPDNNHHPAEFGWFDLVDDVAEIRTAIAVGLGCDTLPGGAKNIGKETINEFVTQERSAPLTADDFYQFYDMSKGNVLNKELYRIFSVAMLFEPANIIGEDEHVPVYIHERPTTLPAYLEEFALGDTSIVIDYSVARIHCCGPDGVPHIFCQGEPTQTCYGCGQLMCIHCVADMKHMKEYVSDPTQTYCLPCLRKEVLCGGSDTEDGPTTQKMREVLRHEYNIPDVDSFSTAEVIEIYDAIVTRRQLEVQGLDAILYPLQSSKFMDHPDSFEKKVGFELENGGQIVLAEELINGDLVGLLQILSQLVRFPYLLDKTKHVAQRALPGLLVDIAQGSRIDGGQRLMKRAARHAIDDRSQSLLDANGSVCVDTEGTVMLIITTSVRASMKKDDYENKVCFSKKDLVSCSCACPSGSAGDEKVVCVHTLAALLKFVYFLLDGLAEHVLTELAARWKVAPTFDDHDSVHEDILRLMCVVNATKYSGTGFSNMSVSDLLEHFTVGTERPKNLPRPPPINTVFKPLKCYKFQNPSTAGVRKVKEKLVAGKNAEIQQSAAANDVTTTLTETPCTEAPSYWRINACRTMVYMIMNIPNEARELGDSVIGNRLLKLRAENAPARTMLDIPELDQMREDLNFALFNATTERKHPSASLKAAAGEQPSSTKKRNNNVEMLTKEQQPNKKVRANYTKCCPFPGCESKGQSGWHRIPKAPTPIPHGSSYQDYVLFYSRSAQYEENLRRIPSLRDLSTGPDAVKDIRICPLHPFEKKKELKTVTMYAKDGTVKETLKRTLIYDVPSATGVKNLVSLTASRGVGFARFTARALQTLKKDSQGEGESANNAQLWMALQCAFEVNSPGAKANLDDISPQKKATTGLDVHDRIPRGQKLFRTHVEHLKKQYKPCQKEPTVTPFSLTPIQVKARTGFPDAGMLISFIVVVCDGLVSEMMKRQSMLTWYEEWFQFFEVIYGKSVTSIKMCRANYGLSNNKYVNKIVESKLQKVLEARSRWPTYVSLAEDAALRDPTWNSKYAGKRVVFWDNTGIDLHRPTDGLLQSLTYSSYYAGNVAKGGVFIQLCGWLGTHELYPGAISDTKYMNECGVLEQQKTFQEADGGVQFMNILDRGYRSTKAAWKNEQFVLQPTFQRSDTKFTGKDVRRSASIAADRSGNERAVRVAKMSSYVKRGTEIHKNTERLSSVWLIWAFQTNYMFKPVM